MPGYDRLTPEGKRFYEEIKKLSRLECHVGFQKSKKQSENKEDEKEVDICDIAAWNELGTVNIPSRPFIRNSVDKHQQEITAMCKAQIQRLAEGATAQDILTKIGVYQVGLIKKEIIDGDFLPNKDSTIKRKKSDTPLIDTGRLRNSVSYVITEEES